MLILQKLEDMATLSPNEKEVAKYLIQHQLEINKISINDIAHDTYTSPSTTVRLAKKLGFNGWKELKRGISDELKYIHNHYQNIDPNFPFTSVHSVSQITKNIGNLLSDSIYDTMNLIDIDSLSNALNLLYHANTIYVYGITNAISVAYDFKYAMRTIGRKVEIIENIDEFPYTVTYTTHKDASIFISYSGENKELLKFAHSLYRNRFPIISITSIGENSLSLLSDVTLTMCTREKLYSKINNFTSKTATFYILNLLFSSLFFIDYQKNLEIKMKLSKQIDVWRSSDLELLKEEEYV